MRHLSYVHVFMSNPENSYITDAAYDVDVRFIKNYFLDQTFQIPGTVQKNVCVGFHFYSAEKETDYFIGEVSQDNLDKFRLNNCFKLVGVTRL